MPSSPPAALDFGAPAPDFALPDTDGRIRTLAELRGPKGLLVAFICNHCPYVKAIAGKLVRDAADLARIGVSTVAICSNDAAAYPEDGFDRMGEFARAHGFPFPYLHDESQQVARAFGAVCTPDFFGYDAGLRLRYRGRLDAAGRSARDDLPRELFDAMRQVAETGRAPQEQTPPVGCSIKWRAA